MIPFKSNLKRPFQSTNMAFQFTLTWSLALRLSFKIVAQDFGSASQLSCVPNSSSESQGFIGCYFLSSPLVASQSYEARPTLSASADKHSLTDTCRLPNKKTLSSKFRSLVSLLMACSTFSPSCPIAQRIPGIGTREKPPNTHYTNVPC